MHTCRWVGYSGTLKNGLEALVGLVFFGHSSDLQSACIERLHMLGRTKPGLPQLKHFRPMEVDAEYNEKGDEVGHNDMRIEK